MLVNAGQRLFKYHTLLWKRKIWNIGHEKTVYAYLFDVVTVQNNKPKSRHTTRGKMWIELCCCTPSAQSQLFFSSQNKKSFIYIFALVTL